MAPFVPRVAGFDVGLEYDVCLGMARAFGQLQPMHLDSGARMTYDEFAAEYMRRLYEKLPADIVSSIGDQDNATAQQLEFGVLRRAALCGALGADAAVKAGDLTAQYRRIMEAYVRAMGNRDNDIRAWLNAVKRRKNENQENLS
jgi:hypothetical protein